MGLPELIAEKPLPVFDTDRLRVLAEQTSQQVAQAFLEDYVQLLPTRVARIVSTLDGEDLKLALDAVVSLKVTSAMTGALRLEAYARDLQRQLELCGRADSSAVNAELLTHIARIAREDMQYRAHDRVKTTGGPAERSFRMPGSNRQGAGADATTTSQSQVALKAREIAHAQ